jgi:hypothetical protein
MTERKYGCVSPTETSAADFAEWTSMRIALPDTSMRGGWFDREMQKIVEAEENKLDEDR